MSAYSLTIPLDVANLFIDVLKKEKVYRVLYVTHTAVQAIKEDGVLCYVHDVEIVEPHSFVFPLSITSPVLSDLTLTWRTNQNGDEVIVCDASFSHSDITVPIVDAGRSNQGTPPLPPVPEFTTLPPAVTSVIPSLSKYTCSVKFGHSRIFPGVVFTNRSAFATTGTQCACWSDITTPPHEQCETTACLVEQFKAQIEKYNAGVSDAFAELYRRCISSPEDFWERLDFSDEYMYHDAAEWLQMFKEQFPDETVFIEEWGHELKKPPNLFPMHFPKYLEKMLVQDECSYAFDMYYTDSLLNLPVEIKNPANILFFLSTLTYGGRLLPGQLVWFTAVDVHLAKSIGTLDMLLYSKLASLDETSRCIVPVSVFKTFQKRAKIQHTLTPTDVPNVVFANHSGMLGIGVLLDGEITSTATTIPCPKGLGDYVVIPPTLASIPIPHSVNSVTLVFKEDDVDIPVYVLVGNMMYAYARLDKFEGSVRVKSHVKQTTNVIATPKVSKFGLVATPVVTLPVR